MAGKRRIEFGGELRRGNLVGGIPTRNLPSAFNTLSATAESLKERIRRRSSRAASPRQGTDERSLIDGLSSQAGSDGAIRFVKGIGSGEAARFAQIVGADRASHFLKGVGSDLAGRFVRGIGSADQASSFVNTACVGIVARFIRGISPKFMVVVLTLPRVLSRLLVPVNSLGVL